MRVIGGQWRGRPLVAPAGQGTRPTSDKVREAVFDVLAALPEARQSAHRPDQQGALAGHVVLDLFAGSGALGIEALSRGAASCTFIERERAALKALHINLERLGVGTAGSNGHSRAPSPQERPRGRVLGADAERALRADALKGARYTLVFVDPPYGHYPHVEPTLTRELAPLLAPNAVLVVETDARTRPQLPWRVVREKRYGDTQVTFLVTDDTQTPEGADGDDDAAAL
jgi:16S rRNA (guanine966-N2)-methyltransferase